MKKALIMLLVVSIFGILFAGCRSEEKQKNEITIIPQDSQSESFGINQEIATGNEPDDIGNPLAIETPYGTLYYPDKWAGSLRSEEEKTDGGITIKFYGTVNEKEEILYMIMFGCETDNSFPVGTISGESFENVQVNVELSDFTPDSSWSQDAVDTMCAMQESVNYIIEKLEENPNFKGD